MPNEQETISVTEAQEKLLNYWHGHQRQCGCAPRAAINPGHVRELLANISIVELSRSGSATFRLAGSKLRDIVGTEARGRSVSTIQGGDLEPWCDAILSVLDARQAHAGITERGDELCHVWLRLPLLDSAGKLTQVMCHDELISKNDLGKLKTREIAGLIPQQHTRYAA